MRLNSASLNGSAINGVSSRRIPVYGVADAIAGFDAELTPIAIRRGFGATPILLNGDFLGQADRFFTGDLIHVSAVDVVPTMTRNGRATATMRFAGDLFYSKTSLGFGSAVIEFVTFADVGVVFITGETVIHPMIPELDGARGRVSSGIAVMNMAGDADGSAIRQGYVNLLLNPAEAVLEPSHIDFDGNRYVGMFAKAPVLTTLEEEGTFRRSILGPMHLNFTGSGWARREQPTLAGAAIMRLMMEANFNIHRFIQSTGVIHVHDADWDGQIYTPIAGTGVVNLVSNGVGYVFRRSLTGQMLVSSVNELDGVRLKLSNGTSVIEVEQEGTMLKGKGGSGIAQIVLFKESEGYVNITNFDPAEQTFIRPEEIRDFLRIDGTKVFWRFR